jgi:hypothetical protein
MPPLVQTAIRLTMGKTYWSLGDFEKAAGHLTEAYALYRQHAGEDHADTLDAAFHLARLHLFQSDFSKAEPLLLRVLDGRRRLLGADHADTLDVMRNLGLFYLFQDEPARAETFFAPVLQASLRHGDRDPFRLRPPPAAANYSGPKWSAHGRQQLSEWAADLSGVLWLGECDRPRSGAVADGTVKLAVDRSGSTATQTVARLTFSGALTKGVN